MEVQRILVCTSVDSLTTNGGGFSSKRHSSKPDMGYAFYKLERIASCKANVRKDTVEDMETNRPGDTLRAKAQEAL